MHQAINFSYSLISRICKTALVLRTQRCGVDMQRTLTATLTHTGRKNTNQKKKISMIRWLANQQLMQKHDNYTSSLEGGLIDLLYKC